MDPQRYQAVKELFAAALEQPEGRRGEFLEGACGGDRDLRGEVEELLSEHLAEGSLTPGVLADLVPKSRVEAPPHPPTPPRGVTPPANARPHTTGDSKSALRPSIPWIAASIAAFLIIALAIRTWGPSGPGSSSEDPRERAARIDALASLGKAHAAVVSGQASEALAHLSDIDSDHRDWDWHYLRKQALAPLGPGGAVPPRHSIGPLLLEHRSRVVDLDFDASQSPLTLDAQGVLRGWDDQGQARHASEITKSPSPFAASSERAGLVRTGWMELLALDPTTHELLTRREFQTWIQDVAINARGDLAALRIQGGVHVVDVPSLESVFVSELDPGSIDEDGIIAISPDGRWLATQGSSASDGTGAVLLLWGLGARPLSDRIPISNSRPTALAFSPDGNRLVAGFEDGRIRAWRTADASWVFDIEAHRGAVLAVDFSPRGRRIASGGDDGELRLWDSEDGTEAMTLASFPSAVSGLGFSPDGWKLAATIDPSDVRVYDAALPGGE